jgi:hypothetical protein
MLLARALGRRSRRLKTSMLVEITRPLAKQICHNWERRLTRSSHRKWYNVLWTHIWTWPDCPVQIDSMEPRGMQQSETHIVDCGHGGVKEGTSGRPSWCRFMNPKPLLFSHTATRCRRQLQTQKRQIQTQRHIVPLPRFTRYTVLPQAPPIPYIDLTRYRDNNRADGATSGKIIMPPAAYCRFSNFSMVTGFLSPRYSKPAPQKTRATISQKSDDRRQVPVSMLNVDLPRTG